MPETIGSWTPAKLRAFITSKVLGDPGAIATPKAPSITGMKLLGASELSSVPLVSFDMSGYSGLYVCLTGVLAAGGAVTPIDMRVNNDATATAYTYITQFTAAGVLTAEAANIDGQTLIRVGAVDTVNAYSGVIHMPNAGRSADAQTTVISEGHHAVGTGRLTQGFWTNPGLPVSNLSFSLGSGFAFAARSAVFVYGLPSQ